ncbi:hypothetical protein [Haloactinospora alba]|uniref:hypothetical protein n=1 Tax=Haloactinospora alba TaxID=405555 RepID=UPI0011539BB2|nr:hypothetical protein [Haloactinospora alba]
MPEPVGGTFPDPEWIDPEEHSPVRPYVTELERLRQEREYEAGWCPACGSTTTPEPAPPTYGDGLDDVREALSPLVRRWLSQREEKSTVGVAW